MASLEFISTFGGGVVSHVAFFNKGEHHLYVAKYIQLFFAVAIMAVAVLSQGGQPFPQALRYVSRLASFYLAGTYSSLIIYRLLLHPLNKFPGPLAARVSNFWFSCQMRKGSAHHKMRELHNQYGDFVRIGSSDLSITHPKAIGVIYGMGSKCMKSPFYDLTLPLVSLNTQRSKELHDKRRRIWSPAFSEHALRGYEERIHKYQDKLLSQIEAFGSQPINVTKWFNLYGFDVMGDLAFGTSFNMLETSKEHWAIKLLNTGLEPMGWMFPVWLFRMITAIPGLTRDWWKFIEYCTQKLEERRKETPAIPDIMSSLLEPLEGKEPTREDLELLIGDCQLVIFAGSDSTSSTLTHIILELSRHPEHIQKLREELAPYMLDLTAEIWHQKISNLDHLNGVISEALRLHPVVPTALERTTPPEGIEIGDVHVPGNMTVWCPQFVIGRKEEVYTDAEAFIPERWYLYPEMIKEKSAWAPFSIGTYSCIGKPLAMLNLRTTIARLVMKYDIGFPDGDADAGVGFEARCTERFTICPPELDICFKPRKM